MPVESLIFNDGLCFFTLSRDLTSVNLTSFEVGLLIRLHLFHFRFRWSLSCRWRKNSILMYDHELPSETRCRRRDVATTVAIWQTQSSNTGLVEL